MNDKMNSDKEATGNKSDNLQNTGMPRRSALKALAGIPVAGILGFEIWKKTNYDNNKRSSIIKELGLDDIDFPQSDYGSVKHTGDMLRIGMIGFGSRTGSHTLRNG
ncbi:MAG: hypothetical protein PHH93_07275 [Prolixibacteraceae bacterium]|nr:hypothetical protein [Prolixibacteraceae bacterium]